MGNAGSQSLSVIPPSDWVCHRGEVLPDHEQMGLAATRVAEAH